jgi:hypothetical protein
MKFDFLLHEINNKKKNHRGQNKRLKQLFLFSFIALIYINSFNKPASKRTSSIYVGKYLA